MQGHFFKRKRESTTLIITEHRLFTVYEPFAEKFFQLLFHELKIRKSTYL